MFLRKQTNSLRAGMRLKAVRAFTGDANGAWPREADSQGAILKYVCVITVSQ